MNYTKLISSCFLMLILASLAACSSAPRTKFSDPFMRIMIDPTTLSSSQYARLEHALLNTGAFTVLARGESLRAIKHEQETLHRTEIERYEDKEKWAHWSKLYGAASVVLGSVVCRTEQSFWNRDRAVKVCLQSVRIYNASTGEAILSVEGQASAPISYDMTWIPPSFEKVVDDLVEKYPKEWEQRSYDESVRSYQSVSHEEAILIWPGKTGPG